MAVACLIAAVQPGTTLNLDVTVKAIRPGKAASSYCANTSTSLAEPFLEVELEDAQGRAWTLFAGPTPTVTSVFTAGDHIAVSYEVKPKRGLFERVTTLTTIQRSGRLEWFASEGSEAVEIPTFEASFYSEGDCRSDYCSYVDRPAIAKLGATTVSNACGDRLGDFVIHQRERINPGSGVGGCDGDHNYGQVSGRRVP